MKCDFCCLLLENIIKLVKASPCLNTDKQEELTEITETVVKKKRGRKKKVVID